MRDVKKVLMSVSIVAFSLYLINGNACEQIAGNDFDHIVAIVKDKTSDTELYNFRTGSCERINRTLLESDVNSYLPNDETSLGLYALFRKQGDSRASAIKHTYNYIAKNEVG